ncbi:MAG: hypothetical protein IPM99_09430 [Rubrivivax sp.]|nr:hypothetical protein [Rubrivivax sp.]
MSPAPTLPPVWTERWHRLAAAFLRGYHRYATWLVGISWKRFALLALALLIIANIVPSLPPFSWRVTETIEDSTPRPPRAQQPPAPPAPPPARTPSTERPREPVIQIERPASSAGKPEGLDISIDERGIRITPRAKGAASAASAASAAPAASSPGPVVITLPPGIDKEAVREAVDDARQAIEDAVQAQRDAAEAAAEAAPRPSARRARRSRKPGARSPAPAAASSARARSAGATSSPTWRCCGCWPRRSSRPPTRAACRPR